MVDVLGNRKSTMGAAKNPTASAIPCFGIYKIADSISP
jgi:hypothetical protein